MIGAHSVLNVHALAIAACAAKLPAGKWIKGGQYGSDFFVKNKLAYNDLVFDHLR